MGWIGPAWGAVLLGGGWPLWRAWRVNAGTTLRPALLWTAAAWMAWLAVACGDWIGGGGRLGPYVALALTGCAGVAVLGARRPGVGAWNFVVAGLLAVLLLPVAEGLGQPRLDTTRLAFLAVTVAAGLANYLPTRFLPAALALGAGCAVAVADLAGWPATEGVTVAGRFLVAVAPWLAQACALRPPPASGFDRAWLAFRDRYGFLWAQRQREQFNRAAANAGLAVELGWSGLRPPEDGTRDRPDPTECLATLHAVLRRFGPEP
jgi:hypothetical protein